METFLHEIIWTNFKMWKIVMDGTDRITIPIYYVFVIFSLTDKLKDEQTF